MTSLADSYAELLALTQLFLLQDYTLQDYIPVDTKTYQMFKSIPIKKEKITQVVPVTPRSTLKPVLLPEPKPAVLTPPQPSAVIPEPEVVKTPIKHKEIDLKDIEHVMLAKFPNQKIVNSIPSNPFKTKSTPIAIILFTKHSQTHMTFFSNMAKAINDRFGPTEVLDANKIEQLSDWHNIFSAQSLRLVILENQALETLPQLQQHLKEIKTVLLSNISLYLENPQHKAPLWKQICSHLTR